MGNAVNFLKTVDGELSGGSNPSLRQKYGNDSGSSHIFLFMGIERDSRVGAAFFTLYQRTNKQELEIVN